jgi:hypothetical protein
MRISDHPTQPALSTGLCTLVAGHTSASRRREGWQRAGAGPTWRGAGGGPMFLLLLGPHGRSREPGEELSQRGRGQERQVGVSKQIAERASAMRGDDERRKGLGATAVVAAIGWEAAGHRWGGGSGSSGSRLFWSMIPPRDCPTPLWARLRISRSLDTTRKNGFSSAEAVPVGPSLHLFVSPSSSLCIVSGQQCGASPPETHAEPPRRREDQAYAFSE